MSSLKSRKVIGKASKKRWEDIEYRNKVISRMREVASETGSKKIRSDAQKNNWRNPEYRRKWFESLRSSEERFWMKVIGQPDIDACWLWMGCVRKGGYGRFRVVSAEGKSRIIRAHRFAYELMEGAILEGLEPDHLCRNPRCVNPAHIELVSHQMNMHRSRGFHRKTCCGRGHLFDEDNTIVRRNGKRLCRICNREWRRRNSGAKDQGL